MIYSKSITKPALLFLLVLAVNIPYVCTGSSLDSVYHVVWPPDEESGTFYLSSTSDPSNNRYARKGYIQALTPITIKIKNNKYASEWFSEVKDGPRYEYFEFISASGAEGYIKGNSIKPLSELATNNNRSLLDAKYRFVVVPIHPKDKVIVHSLNSNNELNTINNFSRSALDFITTDGLVQYKKTGKHEQHPYISVQFFQLWPDGTSRIRKGWIAYEGNRTLFELFEVSNNNTRYLITAKEDESYLEKIKGIWEYWINNYDDNTLERAMKKGCDSQVDITFNIKGGGKIPVYLVKLEGSASGQLKYQFPKDYRYASDAYIDHSTNNTIRTLKTIKCKPNTTSDWFVERIIFAGAKKNEEFEIFQDDLLNFLKEYFETPVAAGLLKKREKMIRIKSLNRDSDKDYFSAFYLLGLFIDEEVLANTSFNSKDRLRVKNFVSEQTVEYR